MTTPPILMNTLTETCGPLSGRSVKRGFAALAAVVFSVALCVTEAPGKDGGGTAAGHPAEGKLESFLGEPKLDIQQVYKGGRFPNILVARIVNAKGRATGNSEEFEK